MSEIIEKKGVKVTIVEHEGGSEEFHVMEEKINEYLNTHSEVDGIFTEDVEAYFCLVQAKKRGISIPRDLKIVGYDGTYVSKYCNPPITTIYQDKKELAFKSSELLLNLINEETVDSKKDIIIPIKLIKRKTT